MNKKTIGWMLIILSFIPLGFVAWMFDGTFLWKIHSPFTLSYIMPFLRGCTVPLCMVGGFLISGLFFITRKPKPPPN